MSLIDVDRDTEAVLKELRTKKGWIMIKKIARTNVGVGGRQEPKADIFLIGPTETLKRPDILKKSVDLHRELRVLKILHGRDERLPERDVFEQNFDRNSDPLAGHLAPVIDVSPNPRGTKWIMYEAVYPSITLKDFMEFLKKKRKEQPIPEVMIAKLFLDLMAVLRQIHTWWGLHETLEPTITGEPTFIGKGKAKADVGVVKSGNGSASLPLRRGSNTKTDPATTELNNATATGSILKTASGLAHHDLHKSNVLMKTGDLGGGLPEIVLVDFEKATSAETKLHLERMTFINCIKDCVMTWKCMEGRKHSGTRCHHPDGWVDLCKDVVVEYKKEPRTSTWTVLELKFKDNLQRVVNATGQAELRRSNELFHAAIIESGLTVTDEEWKDANIRAKE